MSLLKDRVFSLIDNLNTCRTADAVAQCFVDAMVYEGFDYVGARTMANPFDSRYDEVPELFTGPKEFRELWHERKYVRHDPTVLRALTTQKPFHWSQHDATTPHGKRILGEAASFGISTGICLPVHSLDQEPACVSLSGSNSEKYSESDLLTLGLAATHFYRTWTSFSSPADDVEHELLTPREKDVLYCAAAGLTGEGINERLNIGTTTNKYHMKNIRSKLGASSMAHAVAKAIQQGYISP